MASEDEHDGIVIIVDLPQPLHKVSELLSTIGRLWPDANVNVKPEELARQLGNWSIEIKADQ